MKNKNFNKNTIKVLLIFLLLWQTELWAGFRRIDETQIEYDDPNEFKKILIKFDGYVPAAILANKAKEDAESAASSVALKYQGKTLTVRARGSKFTFAVIPKIYTIEAIRFHNGDTGFLIHTRDNRHFLILDIMIRQRLALAIPPHHPMQQFTQQGFQGLYETGALPVDTSSYYMSFNHNPDLLPTVLQSLRESGIHTTERDLDIRLSYTVQVHQNVEWHPSENRFELPGLDSSRDPDSFRYTRLETQALQ
ncbi:hypothetical protein NX722_16060 [Endozoicomonas gorgoniicola]|uniref:DUF4292 domain-containing protein n=1 Tax=Endozoicomonas gorgoniicola TaxID=1234144 RepID=A0ABT3MXJ9_9GAMM|nr:hypothetical protein [Endozoicomonas gorgoniicola]MCW7554105.1 hypothetical protein [Endozoicomonas gorgoniicola]